MFGSVHLALLLVYVVMPALGVDDTCPYQECKCVDDIINCDHSELTELPQIRSANHARPFILSLVGNSLAKIPAGSFPADLAGIDFQDNPVTTIDQDAFSSSAGTLTQLWFSEALFTEVPEAFLRLNYLNYLSINNTHITNWNPHVMKHIGATLEILILNNVGLITWPTWIQYLPQLKMVQLSNARIAVPDDGFDKQINTLYSLDLANGILTEIPSALSKLLQLQYLILDNNNISSLNGIPHSLVLLQLSVSDNKISDAGLMSDDLRPFAVSLTDLQLSNNHLTAVPNLSSMTSLKSLYLSYNAISYIGTSEIPSSLKYLDLQQNSFQSLDSFIRNGRSLTALKIQYNSIKEILGVDIPSDVEDMDISFNLLIELTDESFPSDSNLRTLNLDSNPITKVSPQAFACLTKLSYLSMSFTKITRLPLSLIYLTNAVAIELNGNDHLICTCVEKDVRSLSLLYHVTFHGQCGVTSIDNFIKVMSDQCPE